LSKQPNDILSCSGGCTLARFAKASRVLNSGVRVKICGLTCVDDARACAEAGADWIGLNFHPASARYVEPSRAAEIIAVLPASLSVVGVFVDRPAREVADVAERLGLGIVQLHGHEPPNDLLALDHLQIVRAFRLERASAWLEVTEYLGRAKAMGRLPDAVLIDAYVVGTPGGTGASIANDVLDCVPPLPRLILAGGLTPLNVADRVARVRPWMVDVASGVESSPGRKDHARVAAFIRAARAARNVHGRPARESDGAAGPFSQTDMDHDMVDKPHRDL
jgi:phosphoribosylanthranilate isomerase